MKEQSFINLCSSSLQVLVRNPLISLASLFLYLILILLSNLSSQVKPYMTTTLLTTLWLILYGAVALLLGSFIFSGMIGLSAQAQKKGISKNSLIKIFFSSALKYGWKNMQIILLIIAIGALITFLSIQIASLTLSVIGDSASIALLFLLQLAGIIGVMSFFYLASFYLVLDKNSTIASIKTSISSVKKHFLFISWSLLFFFSISGLLSILSNKVEIPYFITELVYALILFPFFVVYSTKLAAYYMED